MIKRHTQLFFCIFSILFYSTLGSNSHAQNIGENYSNYIPIIDESGKIETSKIPLPKGEWTVSRSITRKINGTIRVLKDISLLKVENGKLSSAIEITINLDNSTTSWNDEPCKLEPVYYKNSYGTKLWTQKCLTVSYSTFLQNNNSATKDILSSLANSKISHDFNTVKIIYTRFGDLGKFFIYRYFLFPSSYGLENPRESIINASPYHPSIIKNHPEKDRFVKSIIQYSEKIIPSLDRAYTTGERNSFDAFEYDSDLNAEKYPPNYSDPTPNPLKKTPIDNIKFSSSGSGFFINEQGDVVTNYHVIRDAKNIAIQFPGRSLTIAEVLATDVTNDIAILRTNKSPLNHVKILKSDAVKRGDKVFTLGFPNPNLQGKSVKFTDGSISSISGIQDQPNWFQISVPIQPGNSGGPIANSSGSIIGIVVAKLRPEAALRTTGAIPENINYAIKSNYLIELLRTSDIPFTSEKSDKNSNLTSSEAAELIEKSVVLILVDRDIKK